MKNLFVVLLLLSSALYVTAQAEDSDKQNKERALFGGSLSLGYGIMTSNISEYIGNEIMLPLTGEVMYKGLILQLNMDGGLSKVKKDMVFPDGKVWKDGDNAWHSYMGVNLGYSIYNNKKILIAPYVGYASGYSKQVWWGVSDISEHEPEGGYMNIGTYVDIKRKIYESGANKGKSAGYDGIRITIGAYISTGDVEPYSEFYNGSTIYMSVGLPVFSTWNKK